VSSFARKLTWVFVIATGIGLEAAVYAGDRDRATTLERVILHRVAVEAHDRAAVKRRVRELMEELDLAAATGAASAGLEPIDLEKSGTPRGADGVAYPVWFGTNRKPAAASPASGTTASSLAASRCSCPRNIASTRPATPSEGGY
jgi:hypothetical protein